MSFFKWLVMVKVGQTFLSAQCQNLRRQECLRHLTNKPRSGATLVVTLGILTVLGVMATALFVSSRINRQAGASDQHRATARNQVEEAIALAMRTVEESMTYPNYTGDFMMEDSTAWESFDNRLNQQRLVPIGAEWFTETYSRTNGFDIDGDTVFQAMDVLASPTLEETPKAYVNLLTPQVLRLLPPILTNQIAIAEQESGRRFMSGWHEFDPFANTSVDMKLMTNPSRVAFVVLNCSSLFDANHFGDGRGPTSDKLAATCFSQADVTNWINGVASGIFTNLVGLDILENPHILPFSFLSYDPGPDVYPLHYDCFETSGSLGTHFFNAWKTVDLNNPTNPDLEPPLSQVFASRPFLLPWGERAIYHKFNINAITNEPWGCQTRNVAGTLSPLSNLNGTPWYNSTDFQVNWLNPVTFCLGMLLHEESAESAHRIENFSAFAWSIVNQIDAGRVARVSEFPTLDNPEPDINNYTRAEYAVKDVPLINKVHVFNIFDRDTGNSHPDAPQEASYYGIVPPEPDVTLSNHYAVAVELWYPFAPHDPPPDTWLYVGVVTNAADAVTTTNRPWTAGELTAMYDWMNANHGSTNNLTMMQMFFQGWSKRYRERFYHPQPVGSPFPNDYHAISRYSLTNGISLYKHSDIARSWERYYDDHPLWQIITDDKDLWFTLGMTSHTSWPKDAPDATIQDLIRSTPIYRAFYPETDAT
ncbi:MAG: hypothetical protein FWD59_10530, partial [Micrococcales bacterium]|nr:hypothetical protein [Micrococcales bacterium]